MSAYVCLQCVFGKIIPQLHPRNRTKCTSDILINVGAIQISATIIRRDSNTLFHLPPVRIRCVGGCWDRTQDSCDYGIDCQTL
jgi:hypothetical protein